MGILDDKVVIVTGAGRGIGRGEALECARQGAAVVVAEFDGPVGQSVVDEIEAAGGRAALVTGDVADTAVADDLVNTAVEAFGGLDALVNNAGVLRDRTLVKMSDEEWDTVIRVHLRGHFGPTRAACRYWRANDRPGRIVHTSSTSGILGNFGQANYGAAKAGIAALSTITAMEMARFKVTSNAIAPSAITRMTENLLPEEVQIRRKEAIREGKFDFFDADNIAPLVAFLCSDGSGHISGKVFGVQGDSVEIYQPFTSVAEIKSGDGRWDPAALGSRIDELFGSATGIKAGPENMMAKMRYGVLDHS